MKNLKKICAVVLAVLMLASVAAVSASALDGTINIRFTSNAGAKADRTVDISKDDQFTVAFSLETELSVINSQGTLGYDSSVATLESLEYKNSAGSAIVNTDLKDMAAFNHTEFDAKPAFTKSAEFIVAKFKAVKAGDLKLELNFDELNAVDASAKDVALITDGNVASTLYASSAEITVASDVKPELSATKKSLKAGKTFTLKVTGTESAATFTSSKKSVAAVNKTTGVVTALKKGSATITAKVDGQKLTCKVTVTSSPSLKIGGKKFSAKKTYPVKVGKTLAVKITGKAKSVKNSYKNAKVAKVSGKKTVTSIKIKGVKKGSGTVTVTVNKVAFKIKVKVK